VYDVLMTRRPGARALLISITDGYSADNITANMDRVRSLDGVQLFAAAVNKDNNMCATVNVLLNCHSNCQAAIVANGERH
jgi:hypothetical protein